MSKDTTKQSANTKSTFPTPIMGGVRTPIRQFASCVLVDIDDTLDSIFSSDMVHWQICCTKGWYWYQRW